MSDVLLIICGCLAIVLGIIGCIIPALPGPVLVYGALRLLHLTSYVEFSPAFLLERAIIVLVVLIFDALVPVL